VPIYDLTSMYTTARQHAASPNYSQFLNFDGSDDGSRSAPSEDVSSESLSGISSNTLDNSDLEMGYDLNVESDMHQIDNLSYACINARANQCRPQRCGSEPTCLELTNLPEIEECNAAPCLSTATGSYTSRSQIRRSPRRKLSGEPSPMLKHKEEQEKKSPKHGQKPPSTEDESAHIRAKQAHSVVERRYRDNLNGKIIQLHRTLVAAESTSRLSGISTYDMFNLREHRGKFRKSDVMTDAMNYVHQSEVEMRHMSDEMIRLNDRLNALERLVRCEDCTPLKQMVRLQLQQ
jgi:hypothetical protein